jgi:uncharacterized protein (DUF58 family)
MYTKQFSIFIIAIISTLLLAIILEEWKLYLVVIILISELFFSMINIPENIDISANIEINGERFYINDEVAIKVLVHNKGDTVFAKILLNIPSNVLAKDPHGLITILKRNELRKFDIRIKFIERGKYEIGPVNIIVQDILGTIIKVISIPIIKKVTVFPLIRSYGILDLEARRTGPWPGSIISKRLGTSMEFHALKDYITGDDVRKINWKASARFRRLISNEYESENVTDSIIVIDANNLTSKTEYEKRTLEACVSGAAALSYELLAQGNRVGLICLGGMRNWIKPGFGKRQLLKILYMLAEVKPGKELPADQVLLLLTPYMIKSGSKIFFISPLMDESIIGAVEDLIREGYSVIVIFALCDSSDLSIEILNLQRNIIKHNLLQISNVVTWDCETNIIKALMMNTKLSRRRYHVQH